MFVESIHLPDFVKKRKPDVVLVELESGKKWLGVEESGTFQQCREAAGEANTNGKGKAKGNGNGTGAAKEGEGKAEVRRKENHGWKPIAQFWEFKMRNKLDKLSTTSKRHSVRHMTWICLRRQVVLPKPSCI